MQALRVRKATADDVERVSKLARAYSAEIGEVKRSALARQQREGGLYVAEIRDELKGFVSFRVHKGGLVSVYKVLVVKKSRRRGVGRTLMASVMLRARAKGKEWMRVKCTAGSDAGGFFKALGFLRVYTVKTRAREMEAWEYGVWRL